MWPVLVEVRSHSFSLTAGHATSLISSDSYIFFLPIWTFLPTHACINGFVHVNSRYTCYFLVIVIVIYQSFFIDFVFAIVHIRLPYLKKSNALILIFGNILIWTVWCLIGRNWYDIWNWRRREGHRWPVLFRPVHFSLFLAFFLSVFVSSTCPEFFIVVCCILVRLSFIYFVSILERWVMFQSI